MSDFFDEVIAKLTFLENEHHLLSSRVERMFRYGPILSAEDIDLSDPTQPRARIHIDDDEDGEPVKSPWLRYTTVAGARNQHNPPSVGQQFMMVAPDGEHGMAMLIPLGHSDAVPSPSTDPATFVDGAGATDVRFKDGQHQVKTADKVHHLVRAEGQRLQVPSIDKLVIKIGDTAMKLKMDALEPAGDLTDFG